MGSKIRESLNKNKKYFIGGAVFLIILLLIIAGNNKEDSTLVRGGVSRGNIASSIRLSGKVESSQNVSLSFTTSGRVEGVYASEGQSVSEGQTLMSLDNASLYADLKRAEASLELQRAQSKVDTAELDLAVENAYDDLLNNDLQAYPRYSGDDYNVESPVVVGSYKGKNEGEYFLEVYGSVATSGSSYRYTGLENGSSTVNEYSLSTLGKLGLFLEFDNTSNYTGTDWVIPIPNTRSSTYLLALNKYKSAVASRDARESGSVATQIANAKIKQAEAEVSRIQAEISQRVIRAPFSGTVSFVGPSKGEIVNSTDIAVSLLSPESYKIVIQIPEIDLSSINIGQIANVTLDAYPEKVFTAKVTSIDPAETIVEGVSVYEATLYLDGINSEIRSGMTATVDITTGVKENVLRIKKQFIEKDETGEYVYILMGDEQVKTYITTGFVGSDGLIEVTSGLSESDILIGKFE